MNTKETILKILINAAGKWVNADEITEAIKLNRTDVINTVNSMMKSKNYPSVERNIKDKTVGVGSFQRRRYTIKYRVKASHDDN